MCACSIFVQIVIINFSTSCVFIKQFCKQYVSKNCAYVYVCKINIFYEKYNIIIQKFSETIISLLIRTIPVTAPDHFCLDLISK